MVTRRQPFLSFPLRRPASSARAQDMLLDDMIEAEMRRLARTKPGIPTEDAIFAVDRPDLMPFGLPPTVAGSRQAGTVSGVLSNVIFNGGSMFETPNVSDPPRGPFNLDRLLNPPQCGALISGEQKLQRERARLERFSINEAFIPDEEAALGGMRLLLREEKSKPNPDRTEISRLEERIKEKEETLSRMRMALDEANTNLPGILSRLEELKRLLEAAGCDV